MQQTKWKDIIVSLIVGVVFGVLMISLGFKFIARNVETSLITAVFLIIISGLLIIFVYRNRTMTIKLLTGIKESDINDVKKNISDLDIAIGEKNLKKLGSSLSELIKIGLFNYSELTFRTWAFRAFFSLLAIFGGVITAGLLVNQNQLLEEQKNLLSAQNKLIDQERKYLVEIDKARFGIKNNGVTVKKIGQNFHFECFVKIENYGKREADSVRILIKIFEVEDDEPRLVFIEELNPTNIIVPNQVVNYIQHFESSSENLKHFIKFQIEYIDNLSKQKDKVILFYRVPKAREIFEHPNGEIGFYDPDKSEIIKLIDL